MPEMAIEIVVKLNGDYPSFKNYVWASQHILNSGTPNNQVDELVMEKLKLSGRLYALFLIIYQKWIQLP